MKKLLYGAFCLAALASLGCAITDYPQITDDRGDFSGVIRTGHKAYVIPSGTVATIWDDGTDELFTMVYQNNYGDQKLYTFNNFDPSASVTFLDQTYCDWRYEGCENLRAWNPHQDNVDDPFDYELFSDCSGARSLSLLVGFSSRIGECGDGLKKNMQELAATFANLSSTTWRGGSVYNVPLNAETTSISLTNRNGQTSQVPVIGLTNAFLDERLRMAIPVTPNARHMISGLVNYAAQNGNRARAEVIYGSAHGTVELAIVTSGLRYNLNRF